jgi:hypothetical protein
MTFEQIVIKLNEDLKREIKEWSLEDRAACIGNACHECNGFKTLQERKPVVTGSLGGWGYFQWTGPRRRAFMDYASKHKLEPSSYEANAGFLIYELKNTETTAIPRTVRAKSLEQKVVEFELAFERAGAKHYDSRKAWAVKVYNLLKENKTPVQEAGVVKDKEQNNGKKSWSEWFKGLANLFSK